MANKDNIHIDYSKIKQNVIAENWPSDVPKSGSEYRSLSKQIDNIIARLKDESSPLQWLPLNIMTETEITEFILNILSRKGKRELFNNLKSQGLKEDLDDLYVDKINHKEQERFAKEFPTLGNTKVREVLPEIRMKIRFDWLVKNKEHKKRIADVINWSDSILEELYRESGLAKMIGIGIHNPDYLEAYADFAEGCVGEILIFEVLLNDFYSDKQQILDFIWKHINRITDAALEEYAEKEKSVIKYLREEHGYTESRVDDFTEYFVSYLKRKSLYEEMDGIFSVLLDEIELQPEIFYGLLPIERESLADYTDAELKELILSGVSQSSYDSKLCEVKELLKMAQEHGNVWVSANSVQDIRVAFRETYISKCRYGKRQAMRIARDILLDYGSTEEQKLFYDIKLMRGYFCEWGILKWYPYYVKILRKIRDQILLAYNSMDDDMAFKGINRLLYDFCDIVYYSEKN